MQPSLERGTPAQYWDQINTAVVHPRVVVDLRQLRFVDAQPHSRHSLLSPTRPVHPRRSARSPPVCNSTWPTPAQHASDVAPPGSSRLPGRSRRQPYQKSEPPTRKTERRTFLNLDTAVETRLLGFSGALDAWRAPSVRQAFDQITSAQAVIVDLEKVSFMDSAGLGALIGGIRRVRNLGGALVMCAPSRSLAKVFKMTGVDRLAPVVATREQAAAALNAQSEQSDLNSRP